MPSSRVGLVYLSLSLVPEPGRFESSGKVSGVGWASLVPLGREYRFDVVTCGVTRWHGRGCRATWLGVGCSGQPVGQGAHVDVVVVWGLCGGLSAVLEIPAGPSARGRQLLHRTGNSFD